MLPLPTLQHATTSDGVRIAFHTLGQGPAVVMLFPYHVSHLSLNWRVGLHRHAVEFLARRFMVVNLDLRGGGESQRRVAGVSLEAFDLDIDAVLARLAIDRACLCAMGPAGLVACHFALHAPERVAGIAFVQGGDSVANGQLLKLRSVNTDLEARLRGGLLGGPDDQQNATALAAAARQALDPETLGAWQRVLDGTRVDALAAKIAAPALCLQAPEDELVPAAATQSLARSLRNATLLPVRAATGMQIWRDDSALDALDAFFGAQLGLSPGQPPRVRRPRETPGGLTPREIAVLKLVAAGKTNEQIGAELFISSNTVSHHLRGILAKTRAANRTEAAAFARQRGLA
jgi:DNA-binding NarL/FixJ family response regulator